MSSVDDKAESGAHVESRIESASDVMTSFAKSFLTDLVGDGRFKVRDEFVSYRFYKQGVKYITRHPDKWQGKMLRKLRIGIRTVI